MCTSFRVTAGDGTVVVGRTMEFPNAMGTNTTVLPVGFRGVGTGNGAEGLTWTATHGVVGMDAFGQPGALTDGMNQEGLYAALLYMPGFCQYTAAEGHDPATLLSVVDTVAYVLGVSATVEEAVEAGRVAQQSSSGARGPCWSSTIRSGWHATGRIWTGI